MVGFFVLCSAAPAPEPAKISFGFAKKPAVAAAPAVSAKSLFGVEEDATLKPLQKAVRILG
jgi:hypothetical protein